MTDFEDAPEITKSGLYKIAYTAEYGTFGGKPYGAIFSNYEFGPGPQDVAAPPELRRRRGDVARARSSAPAGPAVLRRQGLPEAAEPAGPASRIFEGPQYTKWQSFRESEDARYVGLLMPRFLAAPAVRQQDRRRRSRSTTRRTSSATTTRYLWGNATYAMATRIADSFAKYRWCPNIIGPQAGGTVENLPLHQYEAMGEIQTKIPTEVQISERREFELSEEGFIALTFRKDADNACFFSANSCQKPKTFGQSAEGKDAELNYRLGTQLPYMFVVCRIAHYIKVLQREQIGSWKERGDLERELNKWIGQYVADHGRRQRRRSAASARSARRRSRSRTSRATPAGTRST